MIRYLLPALALAWGAGVMPGSAHGLPNGPHQGLQSHAGDYHVEMIREGQDLVLYLYSEQQTEIAAEGLSAVATILSGGQTERVEVKPAGSNSMRSRGVFKSDSKDVKIVVILTPKGKAAVTARFDLSKAP
jgi:hypothetical protein